MEKTLSGFGIVTLASLFPIIAVLLLCMYMIPSIVPADVINAAMNPSTDLAPWWAASPYIEAKNGLQAVIPLVIFLLLIFLYFGQEPFKVQGYSRLWIISCFCRDDCF